MKIKNKRIQKLYFKVYYNIAYKKVQRHYAKLRIKTMAISPNLLKTLTPYTGDNIINNSDEFVWKVPVNN